MGFETPLALLALAAAGLPILAHLLRRRDLPRRKLPTIALLRRAEASSRRNVRLVDLLLLVARVFLVAMAALALAGPFVRVSLAYGDGSVASVAIVVDDSLSMAGRGEPTLLAVATERAAAVLDSLPAGSEVAVILAGAPSRTLVALTDDREAARLALDAIPARSARGTDLGGGLERAERELAGARHADRRVVVLSDLAAHGGLDAIRLPTGIAVAFEPLAEGASSANAAIVDVRSTPDPTTPGQVSVAVSVRASPELDGTRAALVLTRGGEELARETIELADGAAREVLHATVREDDPGATLELEIDDAIDVDDRRGVLLRAPAEARVLVVDGDPHAVRGTDETRFLARALDFAPSDGGGLSRRTVDPDTFEAMDLTNTEVVVLANVPNLSAPAARRLREHVERGGGLLITPGDRFEPRSLEARLGDVLPARMRPAVSARSVGLSATDGALLPAGASGLAATEVRRRIGFEALGPDAVAPLRFEDESPALVIGTHGDGRVAVLATTVDDDWTDLPIQPGFLPLVVRLVRHLAPGSSTSETPIAPGLPVRLRPSAGVVRLRIVAPNGHELDLGPEELEGGEVVVDRTDEPGVYRAQIATRTQPLHEEPRMAFVVAPPADESDLSPGTPPEPTAPDGRARLAEGSVVERPLGPWLFLLVGLLAVLEAVLRHRIGGSRRAAA